MMIDITLNSTEIESALRAFYVHKLGEANVGAAQVWVDGSSNIKAIVRLKESVLPAQFPEIKSL